MTLIIGGYAQGKLTTVLNDIKDHKNVTILDAPDFNADASCTAEPAQTIIVNHFHLWVKEALKEGRSPQQEILAFLDTNEDKAEIIIISDEIGNGIVPMDAFERDYREQTGRILIELAKRADEVERVICGLKQKIK